MDLGARRQVGLLQTLAGQGIGRAHLHTPVDDCAVRALYIEIQPAVRIHPARLGHDTREVDGLVPVVLRGECMVGKGGNGARNENGRQDPFQ